MQMFSSFFLAATLRLMLGAGKIARRLGAPIQKVGARTRQQRRAATSQEPHLEVMCVRTCCMWANIFLQDTKLSLAHKRDRLQGFCCFC